METSVRGQSKATVVAKSKTNGDTITTWELVFPRFITPEILRHRSFSFCQQSSRATPTKILVEQVRTNPAFFDELGINRPGMTASEVMDPEMAKSFKEEWKALAGNAARFASKWGALGAHKQIVNRALEPFMMTKMLVTATSTANFFRQRISPLAQPEIRNLAEAMQESMMDTDAKYSGLHIPYGELIVEKDHNKRIIRGVAASARVCVGRHDGTPSTFEQDWKLVKMLFDNGHMSPFEHVAQNGFGYKFANFRGWKSMRYLCEETPTTIEDILRDTKPHDS